VSFFFPSPFLPRLNPNRTFHGNTCILPGSFPFLILDLFVNSRREFIARGCKLAAFPLFLRLGRASCGCLHRFFFFPRIALWCSFSGPDWRNETLAQIYVFFSFPPPPPGRGKKMRRLFFSRLFFPIFLFWKDRNIVLNFSLFPFLFVLTGRRPEKHLRKFFPFSPPSPPYPISFFTLDKYFEKHVSFLLPFFGIKGTLGC